jgi:hypothetical protein
MIERFGIEVDDLEPQVQILGFKHEKLICDHCGELLETKDYYFDSAEDMEDFEGNTIEAIAEILSTDIEFCSYCDGQQLEDYVNAINGELDADETERDYDGIDAHNFLSSYEIPDKYCEAILGKLKCSSCGHGGDIYHPKHNPDGGPFSVEDRFYTKEEIEHFYGVDYDSFSFLGESYDIELCKNDFISFQEYLYESPLLAYRHGTGSKIFDLLNHIYNDNHAVVFTIPSGTTIYRGRTRKKDAIKFSREKLWNPPAGESSHGRYNLVGISVLYCCENIEGIPYEIHPIHDEIVDIGEFVVKNDLKILDVTTLFEGFVGFISESNIESKTLKKTYLLTNFIRDCCQAIGYHGVKYKGVGKGDYYNYAFFNFQSAIDIDITDNIFTSDYDIVYRQKN